MSSSNTDDLKVKRAGERKQSKSFRLALRALLKRHSRDYEQATVAVSTDDKTDEEDIHIRISTIDLLNPDKYPFEALSYTWGTTENPGRIWIDPCVSATLEKPQQQSAFLNVTKNLFEALLHIRRPDFSRTFWVDAICINQRDTRERSTQVQLMSTIYQKTIQTTVWLGPTADNSNRAFELFRTWTEFVEWDYEERQLRLKKPTPAAYTWLNPKEVILHVLDEADMSACQSLLDWSWFERVRIRQEIALSERCAEVICGNESISWERFRAGLDVLVYLTQYSNIQPRVRLIRDLILVWRMHLVKLLNLLRAAECSDPRDMTYSMLGLLRQDQAHFRDTLQPDYTMDLHDLYIMVCKSMIQDVGKIQILRHCDERANNLRLPSWVPDWSRVPLAHNLPQYYASLSMNSSCIIQDHILNAKGVYVSRVEKCNVFNMSDGVWQSVYDNLNRMTAEFAGAECKENYKSTIEKFIRIIQNDENIADFNIYDTASQFPVGLRRATDLMIEFLERSLPNSLKVWASDPPLVEEFYRCCNRFIDYCFKRSVVLSADGHLALAQKVTEPGDIVVIMFGNDLPLILRPQSSGRYKLIGTAFAPGLVWGEPLVGAFAYPWSFVKYYQSDDFNWRPEFRNQVTGEVTILDPRIDWTQLEVDNEDPRKHLRFSKAYGRPVRCPDEEHLLKNTSVKIETFSLV